AAKEVSGSGVVLSARNEGGPVAALVEELENYLIVHGHVLDLHPGSMSWNRANKIQQGVAGMPDINVNEVRGISRKPGAHKGYLLGVKSAVKVDGGVRVGARSQDREVPGHDLGQVTSANPTNSEGVAPGRKIIHVKKAAIACDLIDL